MTAGGLPERYQTAVWEVSSTMRVAPSYQATAALAQVYLGLVEERFQRGTPWAFQRRAAVLTWLTGRRWRIEGRVQTQSGDEGDRFTEGLTAVEQVQHGIGVVAHQHQRALGQPAAQLQNHLPRPAGELFVPASLLLAVPCRWRQHRQHRTVSTGKAQWRPAQGTWPSHIREIQRRPLALTSCWRLERTASR